MTDRSCNKGVLLFLRNNVKTHFLCAINAEGADITAPSDDGERRIKKDVLVHSNNHPAIGTKTRRAIIADFQNDMNGPAACIRGNRDGGGGGTAV